MSFEDDEEYPFRNVPYVAGHDWSGPNDHRTMMIPQGNETQPVPTSSAGYYVSRYSQTSRRPSQARLLWFSLLMLLVAMGVVAGMVWWLFIRPIA